MSSSGDGRPLRVLMAKVGLDGHDRGLRVVARILRDAGCEVVYAGLRQSPETIAAMTAQEDVDVVGVSMHNGAHLTLAPAVVGALRQAGLETPVVIGGIVPPADVAVLKAEGVAAVLGPGASNEEVVATVRTAAGSPPQLIVGDTVPAQGGVQERHDLVPVADDADVAVLEDGGRPGPSLTATMVPAARTPTMWLNFPLRPSAT